MHSALLLALLLTTPVQDPGDFALVPVRDGFVMAWSDGPRIYTEQLDGNLRAANAPFSFPLAAPSSVTSLALASNGTSVLATWQELRAGNVDAQYAAILDADARSMLYGPLFIAAGTQPAAAGVKNGEYRLVAGGRVWTFNDRLGNESVEILPDGAVAAISAAGETGIARTTKVVACSTRNGGFSPAMIVTSCDYDEAVAFTAPAGRSGFSFDWNITTMGVGPLKTVISTRGSDPLLGTPLVGMNGDGFVGAVIAGGSSSVCEVRDGGRAWTIAKPLLAVAGNGTDVLAVWRDSALRAMFLGGETLTLADDGELPKIVAVGSDTFIVLYRRGSSLVAQKVSVRSPRGRAVR